MARLDPHSYNDTEQPEVELLDWRARVDFAARVLVAEAVLTLRGDDNSPAGGVSRVIDLDTNDLDIHDVTDDSGATLRFELAPTDPILGARLRIELRPGTHHIRIAYRALPSS